MLDESMKLCLAAALGAGAGYLANKMKVLNLLVKKDITKKLSQCFIMLSILESFSKISFKKKYIIRKS